MKPDPRCESGSTMRIRIHDAYPDPRCISRSMGANTKRFVTKLINQKTYQPQNLVKTTKLIFLNMFSTTETYLRIYIYINHYSSVKRLAIVKRYVVKGTLMSYLYSRIFKNCWNISMIWNFRFMNFIHTFCC